MSLEDLETGLQQTLELEVAGGRDQRGLERAVHGLVVGGLVGGISLVEFRAIELRQLGLLGRRLLAQGAAGVVVLRRDLELLYEVERLLVHGLVVAHHVMGEGEGLLVLGFRDGLLGGRDVELPGRVGDVGDLGIGRLGGLGESHAAQHADGGHRRAQSDDHGMLLWGMPERPPGVADVSNAHWMAGEPKGSRKSAGRFAPPRRSLDRVFAWAARQRQACAAVSRSIATSACRLARSRKIDATASTRPLRRYRNRQSFALMSPSIAISSHCSAW